MWRVRLMEKLRMIDTLEENEKNAVYSIIDALATKKNLKENIQNLAKF
jgi:hypothetical protein